MLSERDWVMRLVKQLADFVARALKLAAQDRAPEAVELLRSASTQLLGMELQVLQRVDTANAVELLGTPDRGLTLARLLEALAEVEARADPVRGARTRAHALEVAQAVLARSPRHADAAALVARLGGG
jgi:hypothetical protein